MARNWTEAQKRAIESPARRLLVCAAAGSGKTAVLTERIIRYVTNKEDPGSISRLLVVTFTRAAAAELRSRIRAQLEEKLATDPSEHLAREILAISGARISTIHSFCYDLIRAEGASIGVSRNVRLLDENEDEQLMRRIMDEVIKERCAASPSFGNLTECLVGYRNDANLGGVLIKLYCELTNLPASVEFLRECAESELEASKGDFFASVSGKAVKEEICQRLDAFAARYEKTRELLPTEHKYIATVMADLNALYALKCGISEGYAKGREAYLGALNFAKLGVGGIKGYDDEKTAFKGLREEYKEYLKGLAAVFAQTAEETAECCRLHSLIINELYETEKAFADKLWAAKTKADVCSFSDLEQMALKLLYNEDGSYSPIARSISACFDRVFIDEYQDVNNNQKMIFDAIASETGCFRVGDIKQNIYAFRGSDPSIIDRLRADYDEDGGYTENVFMSRNFRSSKTVLDFINEVFEPVFRGGRFRYDDSDMLICGTDGKDTAKEARVTLLMCRRGSAKDGTYAVPEEVAVADEIERLVREEKLENGKNISYGDIALLFRSYKNHSPAFIRELESRGIPVSPSGKRRMFAEEHVTLMLSVLQTADNPMKDIPLCAVLFSPIFGMTADQLTLMRKSGHGSAWQDLREASESLGGIYKECYTEIEKWREKARTENCDAFIRYLLNSAGIRALLLSLEETEIRKQNVDDDLNYIYDMARSFNAGGNRGLSAFVCDLEEAAKKDLAVDSAASGDKNSVTVMSAHASKGLEFPVCFVCKANAIKSKGDSGNRMQFSSEGGVGTFLTDPRGFVLINTPTREAIRQINVSKGTGEEERILYVALTRARERLYISAGNVNENAEYEAECDLLYGKLRLPCGAGKILDVALRAAKSKPSLAKCVTVMPSPVEITAASVAPIEKKADEDFDRETAEQIAKEISKRIAFEYPESYLTHVPAKISVSQLSPSVLDEAMPRESEGEAELAAIGRGSDTAFNDMPEFIRGESKASAGETGIATHQFLQFCDIKKARESGIKAEAERLTQLGFITKRQEDCLLYDELEAFINGSFALRLEKALDLRREFRFNCFMPAHKLTENSELAEKLKGHRLAVQGVIDGFFLEKDGIYLFDYKTDRIPKGKSREEAKAIFTDRYRWQLSCYAEALRRIFGRKITGAMIYSTALGEAFAVNADMMEE